MVFKDTGPQDDGSRTQVQWLNAIGEDMSLLSMYLRQGNDEGGMDQKTACALAAKEARRLHSDIYRYAKEVHGLEAAEIDSVRT